MAERTASQSVTSTCTSKTAPPISATAASASARSRSQIVTCAPLATNRSTMARPMPCAPPVTTALRPSRSIRFIFSRPLA